MADFALRGFLFAAHHLFQAPHCALSVTISLLKTTVEMHSVERYVKKGLKEMVMNTLVLNITIHLRIEILMSESFLRLW